MSASENTSERRPARRFTESEVQFIRANFQDLTVGELAEHLGRHFQSVQSAMKRLGMLELRATVKRRNLHALHKLTPLELAYLAGIVDGEGTVTVARRSVRPANPKTYYQPLLTIHNTSTNLRNWLVTRGFSSCLYTSTSGTPCWKMNMGGLALDEALRLLVPCLVVKQAQALLVMEFCRLRAAQSLRQRPTPEMLQIYRELRRLNMRFSRPVECISPKAQSITT
jgi:hypothetical protein